MTIRRGHECSSPCPGFLHHPQRRIPRDGQGGKLGGGSTPFVNHLAALCSFPALLAGWLSAHLMVMKRTARHWPIEGLEWDVGCRGDLWVARWRPKGLPYIPRVGHVYVGSFSR